MSIPAATDIVSFVVHESSPGAGRKKILRYGACPFYLLAVQSQPGEAVMIGQGNDVDHEVQVDEVGAKAIVERVPVPPTLEEAKAALLQRLAQRRWEVEIGGITYSGLPLETDDRSKLLITGAKAKADADPAFTTKWKTSGAGWVLIDAPAIQAAYAAVFDHVQGCFDREAELAAAIDAAADLPALEALAAEVEAFVLP